MRIVADFGDVGDFRVVGDTFCQEDLDGTGDVCGDDFGDTLGDRVLIVVVLVGSTDDFDDEVTDVARNFCFGLVADDDAELLGKVDFHFLGDVNFDFSGSGSGSFTSFPCAFNLAFQAGNDVDFFGMGASAAAFSAWLETKTAVA